MLVYVGDVSGKVPPGRCAFKGRIPATSNPRAIGSLATITRHELPAGRHSPGPEPTNTPGLGLTCVYAVPAPVWPRPALVLNIFKELGVERHIAKQNHKHVIKEIGKHLSEIWRIKGLAEHEYGPHHPITK
jgi:hypothetical protein